MGDDGVEHSEFVAPARLCGGEQERTSAAILFGVRLFAVCGSTALRHAKILVHRQISLTMNVSVERTIFH